MGKGTKYYTIKFEYSSLLQRPSARRMLYKRSDGKQYCELCKNFVKQPHREDLCRRLRKRSERLIAESNQKRREAILEEVDSDATTERASDTEEE